VSEVSFHDFAISLKLHVCIYAEGGKKIEKKEEKKEEKKREVGTDSF
jgi:hypothetical protein